MWLKLGKAAMVAGAAVLAWCATSAFSQDPPSVPPAAPTEETHAEPHYDDTFSGPIVELSKERITVSRSVLGKPAEKKSFWIKSDTRVEGKLRVRVKVTVGFVSTDDGDIARLIVVRQDNRPDKKK